ncbi:MAG: ATPase, partial [Clostridium sp.]
MKNSKSYLVAANTCEGFVSYFEEFLKPAKRVMILKGGPGCGKSTFMKKVGNTLIDKGLSVDFIYCASDSESLDAIYVNDVDLIIVDGTAPHVIDP